MREQLNTESVCSRSTSTPFTDPYFDQNIYHSGAKPPFGFSMDEVSPLAETPEMSIPSASLPPDVLEARLSDFLSRSSQVQFNH